MTNNDIDSILLALDIADRFTKESEGEISQWQFGIQETPAYIKTQANVDRMRIVAEIGHPLHSERDDLTSLMEANFHTALDVRYAITDGRLVAAFIHPLSTLTREQFESALNQVIWCTLTSGRENSGGELLFGKPSGKPFQESNKKEPGNALNYLSSIDLSKASVNVTVYQGAVGTSNVNQTHGGLASPSREDRQIAWWQHVIVPLIAALLGAIGVWLAGGAM